MKIMTKIYATFIVFFYAATSAQANVITLDFEGVGDQASINDFYNGGTDSLGNSGVNYGINFSTTALGWIDSDAGGTGNFANEPSGNTAMVFTTPYNTILNMSAGFNTSFSFFYSSTITNFIEVYDGLNGTGTLLGVGVMRANSTNNSCVGDPTGVLCNWDAISVNFSSIAKSINFGAAARVAVFDNITFGSAGGQTGAGGQNSVPEPAPLALLGFGLLGLATLRRRKA